MTLTLGQSLQLAAAALALALATILARVDRRPGAARTLATLLFVESAAQLLWALQRGAQYSGSRWTPQITVAALVIFSIQTVVYVALIRHLPSPLTAPLRHRLVLPVAALLFVGPIVVNAVIYLGAGDTGDIANEAFVRPEYLGFSAAQSSIILVGLYSLAASISAYRRSPEASPGRRRARAFAMAFAARDALFVMALGLSMYLSVRDPSRIRDTDPIWPIATILYVPLLAYGILQTHLFDIDLKIKAGISRSTAASIVLAVVFVVAKVVEVYASRNLGFLAGAIAAGLLLFAAPRLNKIGDKVANTALPNVQATSDYFAYKKLEVYKAAVESAHETGGITAKDRASLDRLREKLGLPEADAQALESEILPASS